jgi:quinol monooxygenase YgiN
MKNVKRLFLILILFMLSLFFSKQSSAQSKDQIVRIAKIKINPDQLESYKAALKKGIETAVRIEPGVLACYAVSDKNNPAHITILEVYANADAYKAHLETPHFKKYKTTTQKMVKSLELVDVDVIDFVTKQN